MSHVSADPRRTAVRVDFDCGTLREVVVGRPECFRLPKLSAAALAEYAQVLPKVEVDFLIKGQGQALVDSHVRVAEQLVAKGVNVIATQSDLPVRFGGGLRCTHHPLVRE